MIIVNMMVRFNSTTVNGVFVLSHVQVFVALWTIAHQANLSMGFPRQEHWSE